MRADIRDPFDRDARICRTDRGCSHEAYRPWTVGVFASLYAGYLKPDLRVTCANLSSVINGLATVVLAVIIDPQVSIMTDDVVDGRLSENNFRRAITTLAGARVLGTLCAQAMLVPAALIIVRVAELI
jgi:hypothetical protein